MYKNRRISIRKVLFCECEKGYGRYSKVPLLGYKRSRQSRNMFTTLIKNINVRLLKFTIIFRYAPKLKILAHH